MELDSSAAADLLAVLDALEARHVVPRIEAAERRRLAARASGAPDPEGWTPTAVGAPPAWYLGIRARTDGALRAEAGRLRVDADVTDVLVAALAALGSRPAVPDPGPGADTGADALRVWLRGADAADVAAATAAGWRERRVLLVLGRALDRRPAGPAPDGMRLAPLAEVGAEAVAALLTRAYEGPGRTGLVELHPDADRWTAERFARVAAVALADPGDLLLAVDRGGTLVGVHWTGRRGRGVGEVFNLAVDPAAAGHGVGRWLLDAGTAHLAGLGLREALLWVDRRNAPALALYTRAGFTERGRDVALVP